MKLVNIGLLWHSARSGNLGVGALTVGNIALISQAAAEAGLTPYFTLFGPKDVHTSYVEGANVSTFDITGRSLISPARFWRTIGKMDCVLDIGGGDSWTDIYGKKRFAYLWLTKMAAVLQRKPLIFSPQTIGPFSSGPIRWLAAFVMKRSKAVVARDPQSFCMAKEMTPNTTVLESVDVAFALPFRVPSPHAGVRPRVGINVSGLLFHGGYNGANDYGLDVDYAQFSRCLIEAFIAVGAQVELITHVNARHIARDDDGSVADQLALEFPEVVRIPDFVSPSEAKSHISGLDFLVAGRMHACIAAFSSGVPVVPVAYSRKFSGLFEGSLNYHHVVPVVGLSSAEALKFVMERYIRRSDLRGEIKAANNKVAAKFSVYTRLLVGVLGNLDLSK